MPSPVSAKFVHRSYALKLARELNVSKRQSLADVAAEWQRTLQPEFKWYWAPFWKSGLFNPRLRCSGPTSCFPQTRLVTSQKDLMLRALAGQAQGWASNLSDRGRRLARSIADPVLRHEVREGPIARLLCLVFAYKKFEENLKKAKFFSSSTYTTQGAWASNVFSLGERYIGQELK